MSGFFANNIEEAVLSGCRDGDKAAHSQLFAAFSKPVFTLALRLTGSRPLADEVVQDTFIEVLTKISQYRGDAPIGAWVRRIAVNKALAQLRSPWHKRGESLIPDVETFDVDQSVSLDLATCLQKLGPTARSVLWLHDVEGYTHKEIAVFMEKTVSFSKSQLSRAHQRLNAWATLAGTTSKAAKKTLPDEQRVKKTKSKTQSGSNAATVLPISSSPKFTVS